MNNQPISEKYQRIAALLMVSFRTNHNSIDKKIKSKEIIENLKRRSYNIDESVIREIIGHIRSKDLLSPGFILSDRHGYWYEEISLEEMERVWESEFGRAKAILYNWKPLYRRIKHLRSKKDALPFPKTD